MEPDGADTHHARAQHGRQMPSVKEDLENVTQHGVLFVTFSLLISGARRRSSGNGGTGGEDNEGRRRALAAGLAPGMPCFQVTGCNLVAMKFRIAMIRGPAGRIRMQRLDCAHED